MDRRLESLVVQIHGGQRPQIEVRPEVRVDWSSFFCRGSLKGNSLLFCNCLFRERDFLCRSFFCRHGLFGWSCRFFCWYRLLRCRFCKRYHRFFDNRRCCRFFLHHDWHCRCFFDGSWLRNDRLGFCRNLGCLWCRRGGWLRGCFAALTQGMDNDTEHLVLRSGFAGPDLELAGSLLNEHLHTEDDGNVFGACKANERRLDRVIDKIEEEAAVELFLGNRSGDLLICHAIGSGVDDDIETSLGELVATLDLGPGLPGELLGLLRSTVEDRDVGALVLKAKDGGAGRSSSAKNEHLRVAEKKAAFQRPDDATHIGVKAVELAVLSADDGVAGTNPGREWIGLLQMRQNLLLERHGDGEAVQGDLFDGVEEVFDLIGLQSEVDGVDGLSPQSGVEHK